MNEENSETRVYVTSHNQSGGITAHTVNIGRQRFDLTDAVLQQLTDLLVKERSVMIYAVGMERSARMADKIEQHLLSRGFHINGVMSGSMSPSVELDEPLTVFPNGYRGDGFSLALGQQLVCIDASL